MVSLIIKEVFCLIYSFLLLLSGLFLVGLSIVFTYKIFYNYKFFPSITVAPFIILFMFGIMHLLLTWLAVKGPTVKHDFHIILFLTIAAVLCFAEFGIGVWNIVLWNNVDLESVILLTDSFEALKKNGFNENSAWKRLQNKLQCCGLNGVQDFKNTYPKSCCDDGQELNITCYKNGCRQPLADYATGIMLDGVLMSFLSCILQAFGIFLFWSFFRTLKRDRDIRSARRLAIQKELAEHSTPLTQSPTASAPPVYSPTPKQSTTPKSSKRRSSKSSAPPTPPVQPNI